MTYNVWGLPELLAPEREVRFRTIAEQLQDVKPDVVILQEVWFDEDAQFFSDALAQQGLQHTHRFESWGFGCGLLVASRYPLSAQDFREFTDGKYVPPNPLHVDWAARKGIGTVNLRIVQTHNDGTARFSWIVSRCRRGYRPTVQQ